MKKRIRLLSIILSLSLSLSGCCNNIKEDKLSHSSVVDATDITESEEELVDNNNEILDEKSDVVNPQAVNSYLEYFDDITYTYNGEEFYFSESELDRIIAIGNTTLEVDHPNISTDAYLTFDAIRSNSEKLANRIEYLNSCFIDDSYSRYSEFKTFFEGVLFHILSGYENNSTNDIKEDFCQFQNLSICYGNLDTILDNQDEEVGLLGYYDEENEAIILNIEGIYELYDSLYSWYEYGEQNYANIYDIIMETLTHEMNHIRQHACDCRVSAGQEYRTIGDYSEYVPTLIESSAESSIYNTQDYLSKYIENSSSYSFAYPDDREYECFIILLGVLSNDMDDYYNAIYDSNLLELYEFAGCEDEEDIDRLYHILFNIDGLMVRNDLVFNIGGEKIYTSDVERIVGNEFSYEVLNRFTEQLIEYIGSHDDMSDLDAVCLFTMAENLSLSHASYSVRDENDYVKTEYDQDLINNINNTRIHFEKFIMDYYGLTENDLYLTTLRANLVLSSNEEFSYELDNEKYKDKLDSLMIRFPLMSAIYEGNTNSPMTYQYIYSLNNIDYKSH